MTGHAEKSLLRTLPRPVQDYKGYGVQVCARTTLNQAPAGVSLTNLLLHVEKITTEPEKNTVNETF